MASQMAGESVDETYQTRDASPDVMEWVIPMMSGSFGSLMSMEDGMSDEEPSMLEDLENDSFDMVNATMTVTFDSSSNSQTMDLSTTNETGERINLSVMIDANSDLMSYSVETSNASGTSIISYTLMWGDAVIITVDETLPKTAIPVHWDGLPDFHNYDEDDDGHDDDDDGPPSAEEVLELFDTNMDNYLSFEEFWDSWADEGDAENNEELHDIFNESDYDMNELLDVNELESFILDISDYDNHGDEISPEMVLDMMDYNDDGMLSWDEFDQFIIYEDGGWGDEDERSDSQEHFNYSDSNSDGLLDYNELSSWISNMDEDDDDSEIWMCDNGEEIPADWVNDGDEDCSDGSDEYDNDGSDEDDNEPEMWMCDNGEEIPADWVNDGMEDCADGSDEDDSEMVCYDMDSHTIDEAYENQEDCEYAGLMWTAADSGPGEGGDEHDGGYCHNTTTHENYYNSDEANCEAAGHIWVVEDDDHDDHDETSEPRDLFLTIADNQTFEAPLSDFSINFLSCNSDERSECMVEGEASLSSLTGQIGNSTYVYTDVDMDGMISAGDTLELTGMHPDYQFDLYDSWSDSYVSESGVNAPNMPGFGGLIATISMLGAAFLLPRRDD